MLEILNSVAKDGQLRHTAGDKNNGSLVDEITSCAMLRNTVCM